MILKAFSLILFFDDGWGSDHFICVNAGCLLEFATGIDLGFLAQLARAPH